MPVIAPDDKFERLFGRLYKGNVKPFDLPLFKVFLAPVDATKRNAFFATLRANGWGIDAALLPYQDDEQTGVCAFYDPILHEYRFCDSMEFLRLNGYHISLVDTDG